MTSPRHGAAGSHAEGDQYSGCSDSSHSASANASTGRDEGKPHKHHQDVPAHNPPDGGGQDGFGAGDAQHSSSASSGIGVTGAGETRPSIVLYQQYVSLYEKFRILEDRYSALKKAMNEVLWEVLPKYTEDFNQLPPMEMIEENSNRLGRYEMLEKIGEGRFAQVRLCRPLDQDYHGSAPLLCVKTLQKSMIKDARRGRRVHQEVYALRTLRHPNIMILHDVIHTREHIHLITERLEKDLFEYIHRRPNMSEGDTFILLWQIIEGVAYCHSKFIAHRDLKPENILVNYKHLKQPNVKICDFGLSLEMREPTVEVEMVGSPGFLPPEILVPGEYDAMKGDVWSIGCILLEMVTDADYFKKVWMKPYDQLANPAAFEERMMNSLEKLAELRLKLTDGLCDLLFDMLTMEPSARPRLFDLRSRPWVMANLRRYEMANPVSLAGTGGGASGQAGGGGFHEASSTRGIHGPPALELERSMSEASYGGLSSPATITHSDSTASLQSPKYGGGGVGFTDRLRSRVDAFTHNKSKSFKARLQDFLSPPGETPGGEMLEGSYQPREHSESQPQPAKLQHMSSTSEEDPHQQQQYQRGKGSLLSPKTPTSSKGIKPPGFFSGSGKPSKVTTSSTVW